MATMAAHEANHQNGDQKTEQPEDQVTLSQVALATSHCGAGCALADLLAEFGIAAAGITLFGLTLWADYAIDFAAAWTLGIAFQYFSIKPMKKLSAGAALIAAIKADTLSISAFQIGMYAWMAIVFFFLFPRPHLTPMQSLYWLMMQIAIEFSFAAWRFTIDSLTFMQRGWKAALVVRDIRRIAPGRNAHWSTMYSENRGLRGQERREPQVLRLTYFAARRASSCSADDNLGCKSVHEHHGCGNRNRCSRCGLEFAVRGVRASAAWSISACVWKKLMLRVRARESSGSRSPALRRRRPCRL